METPIARVKLVSLYAPEDRAYGETLSRYLTDPALDKWDVKDALPGKAIRSEIIEHMDNAQIILLCLSVEFVGNDETEMLWRLALELRDKKGTRVVPILIRSLSFIPKELEGLNRLPDDNRPVEAWSREGKKDEVYVNIAQGIARIVREIIPPPPPVRAPLPPPLPTEEVRRAPAPSKNGLQRLVSYALSRRKMLSYLGAGVVVGAAGFAGVTTLLQAIQSLKSVQIIKTPSSFAGAPIGDPTPLFADALASTSGLSVSMTVGKSYQDSVQRFGSNEFNVFWASDYAYVIAKAQHGAIPILRQKGMNTDDPYYYSYILTRTSSGISIVKGLKGKRLAYVDPESTSGYLFPRYAMYQAGLNVGDVYPTYALSHQKSLETIFNNEADACAVGSEFYKSLDGTKSREYITLLQKYNVSDDSIFPIYKSDPLYTAPIAVHPGISAGDIQKLQNGFLLIDDLTLLGELGVAGFASVADSNYNPIRQVAQILGIDLQNPSTS